MVEIGLMNDAPGLNLVSVAQLMFTFNANVLTFNSCAKAAAVSGGKSVNATTPMAGEVSVTLSGDSVPLADGQILACTFTISATAAAGPTALTFLSARVTDDSSKAYNAAGSGGSVTVG